MKRLLLIPFLVLPALGQGLDFWDMAVVANVANNPPAVAEGPTYLFGPENFEATGYDLAGWVTGGAGTINPDYTTTALEGSQSCLITAGATTTYIEISFTPSASVEVYFKLRYNARPTGSTRQVLTIWDGAGNKVANYRINSSGTIRAYNMATGASSSSSATTAGTTYHGWARYDKGTGANDSFCSFGMSTTGTKPTSGLYSAITTGTATANATKIQIWMEAGDATLTEIIVDRVLIDNDVIGNSP